MFIDEPVREIRVDGSDADIEIIGRNRDDIRIEVFRWWSVRWPRVLVEVHGDQLLEVEALCPGDPERCAAQIQIVMPWELDVTVRVDDGDVLLTDVDGEITVLGDASDVWAYGLGSPRVEVETDEGDVVLRHQVQPELLSVSTIDGDVDAAVPAGPYALELDSELGEVFLSQDVESDEGSPHRIEIDSQLGDIVVRATD